MKTYRNVLGSLLSLAIIMGAFSVAGVAFADPVGGFPSQSEAVLHRPVCPINAALHADTVRCHAQLVVDKNGSPKNGNNPSGLGPKDLHAAYATATTVSGKKIIALVDAYDDPNIFTDLTAYSRAFNISTLPACHGTIASSNTACFSKVDQRGGTAYPASNMSWALETSLDVEMAHAMCQNCSILLVEADDSGFNALVAAEDQAVAQGATVISNSWGAGEISAVTSFDSHFNHPGIAITASTGDAGYGVQYPASSPYVTAVGGTTLTLSNGAYAGETAWSGAGSGCSAYEAKPTWQNDAGCAMRTVSDVSAVADPATGAAVYDSFITTPHTANYWVVVGGTSVAAPVVAGVYALANNVPATAQAASLLYSNYSLANFHDVLSGSNGSCSGSYLCTAMTGYDGPTGLGTPKGLGAF